MFAGQFKTLVTMRVQTTHGSVHAYGVTVGTDPSKERMQTEAVRIANALAAGLVGYTFKTEPARKNLNPMLVTDFTTATREKLLAGENLPYKIF